MTNEGIPEPVKTFILSCVRTVEQLEVLLLLWRHPDRSWTPEDVSTTLRTSRTSALAKLESLVVMKVASKESPGELGYRFSVSEREGVLIKDLGEAYDQYRIRVIELIYSRTFLPARSIADAFRIRKKDET